MKIKLQDGREVEAKEVEFQPISEGWNEYRLEDGSKLRIKLVVTRVFRLGEKDPLTGEDQYVVRFQNVVSVSKGK